ERVPPPGEVLPVEERVLIADLAEIGREMAVPEERHALAERRRARDHPVDPPLLERSHVERVLLARIVPTGEDRGLGELRLEKAVDRLRVSLALRLVELLGARAEGGAPQQMRDASGLVAERRDPVETRLVALRPGERNAVEGGLVRQLDQPSRR